MVYAMVCYNVTLNVGGMQNFVFAAALHELPIMCPLAFIFDFFVVGPIAKRLPSAFLIRVKINRCSSF